MERPAPAVGETKHIIYCLLNIPLLKTPLCGEHHRESPTQATREWGYTLWGMKTTICSPWWQEWGTASWYSSGNGNKMCINTVMKVEAEFTPHWLHLHDSPTPLVSRLEQQTGSPFEHLFVKNFSIEISAKEFRTRNQNLCALSQEH